MGGRRRAVIDHVEVPTCSPVDPFAGDAKGAYEKYASQERPASDCRHRVNTQSTRKAAVLQRFQESPLPDSNRRALPYRPVHLGLPPRNNLADPLTQGD